MTIITGKPRPEGAPQREGFIPSLLGVRRQCPARPAKMEAGEPHVSLDLMIRALLAAGMTRGGLAAAITPDAGAAG